MFQHIHTHSIFFTHTPSLVHKLTLFLIHTQRHKTMPTHTFSLSLLLPHVHSSTHTHAHMHTRTHTHMYTQKNWSSIISKPCDIDLDPLFLIEMRHCRWKGFGDKETIFGALEPVSRDENKSSSFTEMVFFRFNGRCDLWRLIDCR